MSNTWENGICNGYSLKYALKYAKYVNKNAICRICTPHFADDIPPVYPVHLICTVYTAGRYRTHHCNTGWTLSRPGLSRPGPEKEAYHDKSRLIFKTRPKKHMKHCVLEKSSLDPLRFAKRCGFRTSREGPIPWPK